MREPACRPQVELAISSGLTQTVTPGVLDDADERAHTAGQCHALALATVQECGGELLGVWDTSFLDPADCGGDDCFVCSPAHRDGQTLGLTHADHGICHVLARLPDGRLVDATGGYGTAAEMLRARQERRDDGVDEVLGRLDPAVLDRLVGAGAYPAPDVDVARTFVQAVLARGR